MSKEVPILPEKKILLVDDDQGVLKLLSSTLSLNGYVVKTAGNGEAGLALAKSEKPDLIILDVLMPSMKGRQVCARLKADSETRDIPVIFLTAKDSPDDVAAEMEAGAVSHVTKPVNTQQLLAVIKNILG